MDVYKVFEMFKDFLIPRPRLCGMFTSLTYKDYKIIGFPTEIFNERYKRSKIEFNFCLVLKSNEFKENDVFSLKKFKEQEDEGGSSDNESMSSEDLYNIEDDMQDDEEGAITSKINKMDQLQTQNLKNLAKKISQFLTEIEVKFSLLSDDNRRGRLFELLDELFSVINSKQKLSLFFKGIIFCFQFYTNKKTMKFLNHYFDVKEQKRPLLIKHLMEEELLKIYERDYLTWLVLENLDLRSASCNQLVRRICNEKFLAISNRLPNHFRVGRRERDHQGEDICSALLPHRKQLRHSGG